MATFFVPTALPFFRGVRFRAFSTRQFRRRKGRGTLLHSGTKSLLHSFHFANNSWDNELNDRVLSPGLPAVVYRVICAVTFCLVKGVLFAKDLILPPLCKYLQC